MNGLPAVCQTAINKLLNSVVRVPLTGLWRPSGLHAMGLLNTGG